MGNRKQPTPMPPGTVRPDPPTAPPRKRADGEPTRDQIAKDYAAALAIIDKLQRERTELLNALTHVCCMIEMGWIPPDAIDDYKPEGAWQLACAAYRDSRAYDLARRAVAKTEGR